jgi:hypothetical protein
MDIIKETKILGETQLQGVTILLFKFLMRLEFVSLHCKGEGYIEWNYFLLH